MFNLRYVSMSCRSTNSHILNSSRNWLFIRKLITIPYLHSVVWLSSNYRFITYFLFFYFQKLFKQVNNSFKTRSGSQITKDPPPPHTHTHIIISLWYICQTCNIFLHSDPQVVQMFWVTSISVLWFRKNCAPKKCWEMDGKGDSFWVLPPPPINKK